MTRGRRSEQQLWEAAAIGHRITHEDDLPPPALFAVAALAQREQIGSAGASFASRLAIGLANRRRGVAVEMQREDPGDCPDPTGAIEIGSEDTLIGPRRMGAAIVHEDHDHGCENDSDGPIAQGAINVYVNGRLWARRNDEMECGARIGEGEPTVLIGGAPSERSERRIDPQTVRTRLGPTLGRTRMQLQRTPPTTGVELGTALAHTPTGDLSEVRREEPQPSGAQVGQLLSASSTRHNSAAVGAILSRRR